MSREAEVEEEERAFERREVRDSRLSGCSCTELAAAWCKASDAGGSKGRREEDEGDEATTDGEEGSRSPCRG